MLRGAELRGRMREWALAWHADFVRANPEQTWALEPTARVLESICAHGLADASDHDRRARLAVVDGSAALIPRVDRLLAARERARARAVAAPRDEEATAIVRHAVADLTRRGAYERPCPEIVRVVRGDADSRVPTVRDRVPLEGDLAVQMRDAVEDDLRDAFRFLREPVYQLTAYNALRDWALWPLVEPALGACPLDGVLELYECRAQAAIGRDDIVVWIEDR